jgi:L-serine dehydratase
MKSNFGVFDIVGPIIIGPSSSHTAGACRLANAARAIFNKPIKQTVIHVYGSFAATLCGHGTDKALVGGLMGILPDDERLNSALDIAKEQGFIYRFVSEQETGTNANLVSFELLGTQGDEMIVSGVSIGGGNIVVTRINHTDLEINLKYNTMIVDHLDKPGAVLSVAKILADVSINIASMNMYRQGKHGRAYMIIETDQIIAADIVQRIKGLEDMYVIYIPQLY